MPELLFHRIWTHPCLSYTRRDSHLCHQQSCLVAMLRSLDIPRRRGAHVTVPSMQELSYTGICKFAYHTVFTSGCWTTPTIVHPTRVIRNTRIRCSKDILMMRCLNGLLLETCTSRRRLTVDSREARDNNIRISTARHAHVSLNKRITACTDGTTLEILLHFWRGEIECREHPSLCTLRSFLLGIASTR